ncbi:uncharacterized protein BYT42DRAFT_497731 [Radiomyces spectabilis]|uniref:uncharacterized protein n=1 Tax=Radiomyces spectabilis TaxID=64574 RepID=UPI00221F299F|nr:uncharacterized protein BYT42DRAFT_497731 [Radiomyces spectabilis]KAI8377845.1 hypothetical protein BYT42DRAFT_497731 [Radiomyces spectabilis]
MPLSRVGCASLLRIFPNLQNIEYDTNYYTFAHRFAGMTRAMVDAERRAIEALFNQRQLAFQVNWNQAMTTEQRLMTGTTEVSEG